MTCKNCLFYNEYLQACQIDPNETLEVNPTQKACNSFTSRNTRLAGRRVMVRSNEEGPIEVGTFVRYQAVGSSRLPVVKFDSDGKEYMAMGAVLPFHSGLCEFLNGLGAREAWDLVSEMILTITEIRDEV